MHQEPGSESKQNPRQGDTATREKILITQQYLSCYDDMTKHFWEEGLGEHGVCWRHYYLYHDIENGSERVWGLETWRTVRSNPLLAAEGPAAQQAAAKTLAGLRRATEGGGEGERNRGSQEPGARIRIIIPTLGLTALQQS